MGADIVKKSIDLENEKKLWNDLIEEARNIDATIGSEIREKYAQWIWEHGRNICTSPLWVRGEKVKLVQKYAEMTNKKTTYMYYGIQLYKKFPYSQWEEVLAELNRAYPDNAITERFMLSLLGRKDKTEKGELAPLHRGLKNAEEITLQDLLSTLLQDDVVYVKVFSGEYQKSYKIVDKTLTNETAIEPAKQDIEPADELYKQAKDLVFSFWHWRGMEGNPDRNWVAREIAHAKRLLKMGLTKEDIFAIIEWRVSDPFWSSKLTSLGLITTRISSWAMEARNTVKSFEEFLDQHPDLDYRKIEATSPERIYARAEKLKEAVMVARKHNVPISPETYEKLYRASKAKFQIFNGGEK